MRENHRYDLKDNPAAWRKDFSPLRKIFTTTLSIGLVASITTDANAVIHLVKPHDDATIANSAAVNETATDLTVNYPAETADIASIVSGLGITDPTNHNPVEVFTNNASGTVTLDIDSSLDVFDITGIAYRGATVTIDNKAAVTTEATLLSRDIDVANTVGIYSESSINNSGRIITTSNLVSNTVADAAINSYGLLAKNRWGSENINILNSGIIEVNSNGGDYSEIGDLKSIGIFGNRIVEVVNEGNITVHATSGDNTFRRANTDAIGIRLRYPTGDVTNSGNLTVTATGSDDVTGNDYTDSVGISISEDSLSGQTVFNSGSITVTAHAGNNISDDSYAEGRGIHLHQLQDNSRLINEGNITVTINHGNNIDDAGYAWAHGIKTASLLDSSLNNSGDINIIVKPADTSGEPDIVNYDFDVEAYGIDTSNIYNGSFTNSGDITITALGRDTAKETSERTVYGIRSSSEDSTFTNSGDIDIKAEGGTVIKGRASDAWDTRVKAVGIDNDVMIKALDVLKAFKNTGDISVIATGGTSSFEGTEIAGYAEGFGIRTGSNREQTIISNEGAITVIASGTNARAIGIEMTGGTLDSKGLIDVTANGVEGDRSAAYQIFMGSPRQRGEAPSANIQGFAMDFQGTQAQLDAKYEGTIGGNAKFTDAKLYVYVNGTIQAEGNTYTIPQLLESDVNAENLQGYFSSYEDLMTSPDYKVISMSDASESELQTITFEYLPQASTPLVASQTINVLNKQNTAIVSKNMTNSILGAMAKTDPRLASFEGVTLASNNQVTNTAGLLNGLEVENKHSVFLQPYYIDSSYDSNPLSYDADVYGFTAGYNYQPHSNFLYGFHLGYGNIDVDYKGDGYNDRKEDIDAGSVGLQAAYRFSGDWVLTSSSTFFFTSNDLDDYSPTNRESADYNTYGLKTDVDLGYIFVADNSYIIPEFGLTYLHYHADSFTTDNRDNNDTHYSSINEDELLARLAVSWYGKYDTDEWAIMPRAKVGIEQTLTDGKYSNTMGVSGITRPMSHDTDETAILTDLGIDFANGPLILGAGYNGYYTSDIDDHSLYVEFRYMF